MLPVRINLSELSQDQLNRLEELSILKVRSVEQFDDCYYSTCIDPDDFSIEELNELISLGVMPKTHVDDYYNNEWWDDEP
jgi:hypothetical protein